MQHLLNARKLEYIASHLERLRDELKAIELGNPAGKLLITDLDNSFLEARKKVIVLADVEHELYNDNN